MEIDILPGMRIKVAQTIDRRTGPWTTEVVGTVLSVQRKPTGAWFAHGKDNKYWLVRIELQKDDGEVSLLILDQHTRIMALED